MGPGVGGLARHSLSLRLTSSDDETEVVTVQDDDVVHLVPQGVSMSDSAGGGGGGAGDATGGTVEWSPDTAM